MITLKSIVDQTPTQSGKIRVRVLLSLSNGSETREVLYLLGDTTEEGILSAATMLVSRLNAEELIVIAAQERKAKRAVLRAHWDSLPAWLTETFNPAFESVNALLDEGQVDDAVNLLGLFQPLSGWNSEQQAVFTAVKEQFISGLSAL